MNKTVILFVNGRSKRGEFFLCKNFYEGKAHHLRTTTTSSLQKLLNGTMGKLQAKISLHKADIRTHKIKQWLWGFG
jgi:hypothetical protein